ncbi:hypothetical protein J5J10_19575 [Ciceribacter sp. L1K23]|nr:hypothetical protein [Ciceribacter sp. L1K23]
MPKSVLPQSLGVSIDKRCDLDTEAAAIIPCQPAQVAAPIQDERWLDSRRKKPTLCCINTA